MFDASVPGVLEIIAVCLGLFAASYHGFLRTLLKEHRRARKEANVINEQVNEEVSVKNLGKYGGAFATDYINNWLNNLDRDIVNVKAEIVETQKTGVVTEEQKKHLEALQGKLSNAQWFIEHKDMLIKLNNTLVPGVIQKLAGKALGGILA